MRIDIARRRAPDRSRLRDWLGRAALVLALVLPPSTAAAEVQLLRVDPLVPISNEPLTFTVEGTQPSPCYRRVILEDATGVEGQVITLWFALELNTSGGTCPMVPTGFSLDFAFEEGFAAGDYEVRVGERTYVRGGTFTERLLQFAINVQAGTSTGTSDWGAIKALFGEATARD